MLKVFLKKTTSQLTAASQTPSGLALLRIQAPANLRFFSTTPQQP